RPAVSARATTQAVRAAASPTPRAETRLERGDTHVQLGSFLSEAAARAAWSTMQQRHPMLKDADLLITRAQVNGRTYHRVAAASLSAMSAQSLCAAVRARGTGCFAYAANRVLPGTVGTVTRIAAR
ncbi:SPOR domain-containing protein, partial [Erythrobacteraceae bacterium CFH 75059]|uniref:SPOR domain-containing protein n=1 Tax=Qipengyuania thermophila TaxID=2509361 RepID=UPI0010D80587